jgi:hypothetical protein
MKPLRPALVSAALLAIVAIGGCSAPGAEAAGSADAAAAPQQHAVASEGKLVVYKSPTCGCCGAWVDHVRDAGFEVEVHDVMNVYPIKEQHGLPGHLGSCHTTLVNGYVVEGHVPADVIRRLLAERPRIAGIAVPGMPIGSPGMEVPTGRKDPYDVIAFTREGSISVFESR